MRILKGVIFFLILFSGIVQSFAAINMTVSPIKYELDANPGDTVTRTATLYNYDSTPINIITGKSDFTSDGMTGGPSFVRYSELIHPDQQLSSRITLSSTGFIIPANDSVTIDFTLNIPEAATPGGHYGAVFFKNNNSESTSGTKISINADYGILILLNVSGEVVTEITIEDPIINTDGTGANSQSNSGGGYSGESNNSHNLSLNGNLTGPAGGTNIGIDNCLIDFTNSNFDGLCYDNPLDLVPQITNYISGPTSDTDEGIALLNNAEIGDNLNNINPLKVENSKENLNTLATGGNIGEDLDISFSFPIKNTGNIHVKPTGSIKLIDETGKQIKGVGKKAKLNEKGGVIGIEVVDYIPVNDGGGNVLPQSERIFKEAWQGFPYQTLDGEGKIVMKNLTPSEYYTNQNIGVNTILKPWERVCYRKNNKEIKALIDITYQNDEGEDVIFSSAKDIPITYTEKYIGINPYIVVPFILFFGIFFLLWFIALGKRTRCVNKECRKRIKRKLIRCTYCDAKQKKSDPKKKNKKKR